MCLTELYLSAIIESSGLNYATPDNQSERSYFGISTQTWGRVLVIAALFSWLFWHNLVRLWLKTNPFTGEANWSHAVCVPIIGLYYLYIHREDLLKAQSRQFVFGRVLRPNRTVAALLMMAFAAAIYFLTRDHNGIALSIIRGVGLSTGVLGALVLLLDWSIAILLFGLGMFVFGIYPGKDDYVSDLGMVISLFGIVLLMCGPSVMKIAWFPIVFLVVALPWPGLVYSWVAEPLSQMAANVAVHVLQMTGVDSACQGTKIVIANANPMLAPRILNVAEACAGMRSLMTFIAVGGAVAFLSSRPLWQKLIVVTSAIPIAIFCNVMRISGQGLLDHYVSPEWSESFAHQFVGMIMLFPAFLLILGVGYLLDKMFIEEADDNEVVSPVIIAPVAAIAARPAPISPVKTMASVALPNSIAPAPVVNRPPPAIPRPAPAITPPRPAIVPRPPMAATPPRPFTAANPRQNPSTGGPRRPVNPTPPKPTGIPPVNLAGLAADPLNPKPTEAQ